MFPRLYPSAQAAQYYQFPKMLETYEMTLGKDATLILTTDSEIFGLLMSSHVADHPAPAHCRRPRPRRR